MGDDSENKNLETNFSRKHSNHLSNDSNVFQSIWIRLSVQDDIGLDEFLLAYGRNFLLRIGTFFLIIFILQKLI